MPDYQIGSTRLWGHASRDDFIADIKSVVDVEQREQLRGVKVAMDLPLTLSGTVAASAITLGIASGQVLGPESGYAWRITRLIVTGLTSGATPDVVNLYKNDRFSGPPLWQFNGNNFGYTFSHNQLVLKSGETFSLKNSGTIAATGTILLSGSYDEVPAEMLGKLGS